MNTENNIQKIRDLEEKVKALEFLLKKADENFQTMRRHFWDSQKLVYQLINEIKKSREEKEQEAIEAIWNNLIQYN